MQPNNQMTLNVQRLFFKLSQIKDKAEHGEIIDQLERQESELALMRLLDELGCREALAACNGKSRAYLIGRTHCLIPEEKFIDWQALGLKEAGLEQISRTAFVLMAGGAGSRLESLRDMEKAKWIELGLQDLDPSDFHHFSKATAPLGPVSKCATTEWILQSILALARQSETRVPVILSYDNKSEFRLRQIMERWSKANALSIYLKKETFGLPAIAHDGSLFFEEDGNLVVASGGTGASLRALAEAGFATIDRVFPASLFDYFHSDYSHIDTLCYLQTDMPCCPDVLLAVLGARHQEKVQVSLAAYNYPQNFQLGVVTKWENPHGEKGFEIVDFLERTPEFSQLLREKQQAMKQIPAYSGLMAFDINLGERIVQSGLFRPEMHWHKKERDISGKTREINKLALSLTNVVIEAKSLSVVMMPKEELLPGKTPEVFAECRKNLSCKAKALLRTNPGFIIDESAMVELSPLAGALDVRGNVLIQNQSRVCFRGPLDHIAEKVTFEGQTKIYDNVTVIFEGEYPVYIPNGSVFGGKGTIILGKAALHSPHPLTIFPLKGELVKL